MASKERKAATEWTIGKLMTLILLVLLIALVIIGLSTKAFNPLYEKVSGAFDSVMIFLGWKTDTPAIYDKEVEIADVGKGILKINPATKECKVDMNGGKGSYKIDFATGRFMSYEEICELPEGSDYRGGYSRKGINGFEYSVNDNGEFGWHLISRVNLQGEHYDGVVSEGPDAGRQLSVSACYYTFYPQELEPAAKLWNMNVQDYVKRLYPEIHLLKSFISIGHETADGASKPAGVSDENWQIMLRNAKINEFLEKRCR